MKFAHIADCHLGSWSRKPELQELNINSFEYAVDKSIQEQVGFIIIAGDFFDTSFPTNTSLLSRAFGKLRELREKGISVYVIPGSHDFSASGESILKVCEAAGLCRNLMDLTEFDNDTMKLNFFHDKEKNLVITGMLGRRLGLEIEMLRKINKREFERELGEKQGLKIFILHTAVTELLPESTKGDFMESISYKELPKGFHYYAAGHIHEPSNLKDENGSVYAYSGCVFPDNFSEMTSIKNGSFIIADFDEQTKKISFKEEKIKFKDVISVEIKVEDKTAKEVEQEILDEIDEKDLKDKIFTLKVSGSLKSGKISDINFDAIYKIIFDKGCFSFLRNTHGLSTKEFEIQVSKADSVENIEKEIIENSLKEFEQDSRKEKSNLIYTLLKVLDKEKIEDELKDDFSSRLVNEIIKSLELEEKFK
ncbi:MAG: DNA repair exonuclease [Nanoarchaeota archaeon]|nr:DNA repair exonuclease [Nanoarchaeota archaeon]